MAAVLSSLYTRFFSLSVIGLASFGLSVGFIPGIAAIAWGVIMFFAGRGLWAGKQWGRMLAIAISVLQVIFGIVGIVMLGSANYIYIPLVVNLIIILYLLFGKNVSAAFQNGKSISTAVILVILALAVYTTMEYPILFVPANTISQADYNKLMQYHGTAANPTQNSTVNQNSQAPSVSTTNNTTTPPQNPNTISNTTVGVLPNGQIYTDTKYSFQLTVPQGDTTTIGSNSPPDYNVLFNNLQGGYDFLIATTPAYKTLADSVDSDMRYEQNPVQKTNTTIAGEPAIHTTETLGNGAVLNNYFLIHNGIYYSFSKRAGISATQFDEIVYSLKFSQ